MVKDVGNLQKDFRILLNKVLEPKVAKLLWKHYKSDTLQLYSWTPSDVGIDGLTSLYFERKQYKKSRKKLVYLYINTNVIMSNSVCWRMSILLHELGHAIHFFDSHVTKKCTVLPHLHHGKCWKNVLKNKIRRCNKELKACASLEESPQEGCQSMKECKWCLTKRM